MLEIKFDGVKLNIPTKWEDVPLRDYESWYLQKPETRLELIQHVADVCKIDAKVLLSSPTEIFNIVSEGISFIHQDLEPLNKIKIFGEDYFINYSDKLTLGEWVDVDGLLAGESDSKLSELLAILCRPRGEVYNPDNTEMRRKLFQEQGCDKALPLIGFFLLKEKKSREIINHSLTAIAQASQFLQDTKAFVLNGDGIKRLPIWQRIRYIYLTKSLEKQLSKFSVFYSTEPISHRQKANN